MNLWTELRATWLICVHCAELHADTVWMTVYVKGLLGVDGSKHQSLVVA